MTSCQRREMKAKLNRIVLIWNSQICLSQNMAHIHSKSSYNGVSPEIIRLCEGAKD
ncbi:hypothetical protein EMIT0P12_30229 [Pseudomonas sp. IT-P12]